MTEQHSNTLDKSTLLELVGKPIFINSFNEPEGYYTRQSGLYFVDSVIFHFNSHIDLGISEYDPSTPIDQFDIDKSHISYFHLEDLELALNSDQGNSLETQKGTKSQDDLSGQRAHAPS